MRFPTRALLLLLLPPPIFSSAGPGRRRGKRKNLVCPSVTHSGNSKVLFLPPSSLTSSPLPPPPPLARGEGRRRAVFSFFFSASHSLPRVCQLPKGGEGGGRKTSKRLFCSSGERGGERVDEENTRGKKKGTQDFFFASLFFGTAQQSAHSSFHSLYRAILHTYWI